MKHETMIIDAFLYDGELDMLELRVRTLQPYVDLFIPVRCTLTHQSQPNELGPYLTRDGEPFQPLHAAWAPYDYDGATPFPEGERGGVGSRWYQQIERQHRDAIAEAVRPFVAGEPNTIVMCSDVDEIPHPAAIAELEDLLNVATLAKGPRWLVLQQRMHSGYLDWLHPVQPWLGTCISRAVDLAPQAMRDARGDSNRMTSISDGGWHFSWFGTDDERQRKLDTFSHAELRGRYDPKAARGEGIIPGLHSNGEQLVGLSAQQMSQLAWPTPLRDSEMRVPDDWFSQRAERLRSAWTPSGARMVFGGERILV